MTRANFPSPSASEKKALFHFNSVHLLFNFLKQRHVDESSRYENFLKKLKNAFIIRSINVMRLHGNSTYNLLKNKNEEQKSSSFSGAIGSFFLSRYSTELSGRSSCFLLFLTCLSFTATSFVPYGFP